MSGGLPSSPVPLNPEQAALKLALERETRLAAELHPILLRQRSGLVAADVEVVRLSVHEAHRVLCELEEASLRRRSLLELLTGDPALRPGMLETVLDGNLAPEVACARDELLRMTGVLSREVSLNRRLLREALVERSSPPGPGTAMAQAPRERSPGGPPGLPDGDQDDLAAPRRPSQAPPGAPDARRELADGG